MFFVRGLLFLAFCSLDLQRTAGDTSITDVRFVNATSGNPGPVEVQYDGEWYLLCADTDYTREALVICRQIGYIGGWAQFFPPARPNGVNLLCYGNEETLGDCKFVDDVNSPQYCMTNVSVGVWCYNSNVIHLVDGPPGRPNIGRVQVQYDDTVTDVCSEGDKSNDRDWIFSTYINLDVLCTDIGYPGAIMTAAIRIQNSPHFTNVYTDDYKCVSETTRLYNCLPDTPVPGKCTNDLFVHAVCAIPGYVGCYTNSNADFTEMHDKMTIQRCIRLCGQMGTTYAILRAGNICRCTGGLFGDNGKQPDSECNIPCAGDPYDICGGPSVNSDQLLDKISVYEVQLAVRQCQDLEIPMNGFVINGHDKNATFVFGAIVQFACNNGYVLVGSPSIQCVVGNSPQELAWSVPTPNCQEAPSTFIMTTLMGSNGTMFGVQNGQASTIIGVTFAVVLFLVFLVILICILCRRYRKKKSSPQAKERVYITVNRDSNSVLSSTVEGISNVYASTDNNENIKQQAAYDRNDKTKSQHIYAASEVNKSSEGRKTPESPTNSSDLPYDYADIKNEAFHAKTPPGVLYASVKKAKDKSSDLSYDKPGDKSAGPSSSSEPPHEYTEVNKVVPGARMPPDVQHTGVKDTKDVSYDQPILFDKSPGQTSSSELPYADVTKVVPGARMPPPASANNGDQASSTTYDLPIHSSNLSGPGEAAPYAYAYAGVNKDKSTGQTTSIESPYDYADVKNVVPGPRMPPGSNSAKAKDEDQALNYDQPIHNSKSLCPADEPAPYAYAYAGVNKDKPEVRQQSAYLYAYADPNELNTNKSSNDTPNGQQDDNVKEGWADNTLYGKSEASKGRPKQEGNTDGRTEGWKKNSIYQSGAAHV